MPDFIVIRLHPDEPTSGAEFQGYLEDLAITAYDLSFADPAGEEIGSTAYDPDPAQSGVVQESTALPAPIDEVILHPAASALIEVEAPAGRPEYATSDVILEVARGDQIIERKIHYNIPIVGAASPPQPDDLANLEPVGAYVALPGPGRGRDPDEAYVELPEDGSPPRFDELRAAVETVLAADPGPGNQPDLAALTPAQCRHIALEIVWNRRLEPLPEPPRPLRDLYAPGDGEAREAERRRFEAELRGYHATLDARAEQLSRYVFSLSAALYNERRTHEAERVVLRFPVRPGATEPDGHIAEAEVVLTE